MNPLDYQRGTRSTAIYPGVGTGNAAALSYLGLGLASEAGEVAGKIKKILRDTDGVVDASTQEQLMHEVGDVLWYLARTADELGFFLSDAMYSNAWKLAGRAERGTLQGSGDNR